MSPPFLANLYRNRRKIKISEEKYPLILCTCIIKEVGLGWYWLKDIEKSRMLEMLKTHISHGKGDISAEASNGYVRLAAPEDKRTIIDMITDEENYFRLAIARAFGDIATPADKEKIIEIMKDIDSDIREKILGAFVKKLRPKGRERLIDILKSIGFFTGESGEVLREIAKLR